MIPRERLIDFLVDQFSLRPDEVDDRTPLFSAGLLDSFNLVDLVGFIERECKCKVGAMEVNLENLDSIERILRFIASKSVPKA
jgi:acyl carrier protein